jgi:uncharacterized protein (DUF58 family)
VAALGMVLYLYGATSEVSWLFLIGFWVWGLGVAAYLYALWNSRGITAGVGILGVRSGPGSPEGGLPEAMLRAAPLPAPIFEGDRVQIRLELRSRSTMGPARLSGVAGGIEMTAGTGRVGPAGWQVAREIGPMARGPLRASDWTLETSDPLGFFRHTETRPPAELGLVLPLFTELANVPMVRDTEAGVAALRAGAGNELFGVREYSPGDPLRRIHWRSSARRGELVVREYEPPGLRQLVIVLEPLPQSPEIADQIARLGASEAWDCIRGGGRAVLWAPGRSRTGILESRSLWAMLEWLARYPGPAEDDAGPPPMSDAVGIAGSAASPVMEFLEDVRRRGGAARAWLVGLDRAADADVPTRQVGTQWPL